ncbi:hypothetical protein Tco_1092211 [Tanacetum coccineum]|uniref:Uncharacterized protein n=1 Tax=Tanacetum coccineum TaxID=301880 RepID=A0ABQ5I992_9ASTR
MSLESTPACYPCNVILARGSFDEDGAVPHKARGALVVGREVGDLASDGHYRMDLFADGHSSVPTGLIPHFYGILLLATPCHEKLFLTGHSHLPFFSISLTFWGLLSEKSFDNSGHLYELINDEICISSETLGMALDSLTHLS